MLYSVTIITIFILIFLVILFIILLKILLDNSVQNSDSVIADVSNIIIVCAKYKKNVNFLKKIPYPHIIIEKGKDVPNIANEATSYLYYIVTNYYNLPDVVVFIHDEDKSWHHEGKLTELLPTLINSFITNHDEYVNFNNKLTDNRGLIENEHHTHFWRDVFQKNIRGCKSIEKKLPTKINCCAQFIVTKNRILCRPRQFYKSYYKWLMENTTGEGNGDSSNRFSGYMTSRYAEWSWDAVFDGTNCDRRIIH